MRQGETNGKVIGKLEALLATGGLPPRASQVADRLAKRLSSPVRIAVLGPPGAGKSTIVNVLAGALVIPGGLCLPSSEIRFGETPGLTVTLGDGSRQNLPTLDFKTALSLSPAFVEIRTPLAMLKRISLLEAVTDGSDGELKAAARWAAGRCDIAIWVTTQYDARQQALWQTVPDSMKDHGLLALSKIDASKDDPEPDIGRNDFLAVFPVAARHALQKGANATDSDAYRASGCKAVIDELFRHADLGRQADVDSALLFLSRFETAPGARKRSASADGVSRPVTSRPGPLALMANDPGHGLSDLTLGGLQSQRSPTSDPFSKSTEALAMLKSAASSMLHSFEDQQKPPSELVLELCQQATESLGEVVLYGDDMHELVAEAADFIVFLKLERSEQAAYEAVVALLQLKRDFEVALSA